MIDTERLKTARMVIKSGHTFYEFPDGGAVKYFDEKGEETEFADSPSENSEDEVKSMVETLFNNTESNDPVATIEKYFRKYIYLVNEEDYFVLALISLLSYVVNLFDRIPYFWLRAEKGSGKTTLMSVLKPLVYNPVFVSNITPSTLFRIVDENSPTLFMDEVEALATRSNANNPIIQILNSGYHKEGRVTRTKGGDVLTFNTYSLKILAGISQIADTVADRCIKVHLTKPEENSNLNKFIGNESEEIKQLLNTIHSALLRNTQLLSSYLKKPETIGIDERIRNRDYDKWMPILTLAKVFSTKDNDYFSLLQKYAFSQILLKNLEEENSPENMAKAILRDFLADNGSKSKIPEDKNYFYFPTERIQKVIRENDQHNTYRSKAEYTLTLKKIGVEITRLRFGKGPVSLYKIPKSILN